MTLPASLRWVTAASARRSAPLIAWVLLGPLCLVSAEAETPPQFEADVLPILTAHCLKCHGLEAAMVGLDLRTPPLILRGGDNGTIVTKGSADESLLYKRISSATMPPSGELKLREEQIETIRRWIDAGLPASRTYGDVTKAEAPEVTEKDRQYWAFQKLARPKVPVVRQKSRVRTPIDAFVLAKLEEKGLGFSAETGKRALIRRAYFDLIGLPPSPEEIDEFLAEPSKEAYEQLLDSLLDSPHFGERWGRHWLDQGGYADSRGMDNDAAIITDAEGKWCYRDYVVRSFNEDKPFDRFVTEQLAGDELVDWRAAEKFAPETRELLIATSFLRSSPDRTDAPELNTADQRYGIAHRTLENVSSSILGLTVGCAKCHSHKYDPIPHTDYYRLLSIFTPAFNPQSWLQPEERRLPDVSAAEKKDIERHNEEIDKQAEPLTKPLAELRRPYEERLLEKKLAAIPDTLRDDARVAVQTPTDKRTALQKYLFAKLGKMLKVSAEEVDAALDKNDEDKARAEALQRQIDPYDARRKKYGTIQAVYDVGPPSPAYLLRRGDFQNPGREVEPGFLSVLTEAGQDLGFQSSGAKGKTSGRRLAFAKWLTKDDTPAAALVARVVVSRLWQHLLGEGIVATADNFGRSGVPPTHPELLEFLAGELIESGWRIKPVVKLIMTSSVYTQATYRAEDESTRDPDPVAVDPGNKLLWRMPLRRLESETIRDAMLVAGGKLDRTIGGAPIPIVILPGGKVVISTKDLPTATSQWRRSLYIYARRNYNHSLLAVFDQPVLMTTCARRESSAVVLQSLAMINDEFVMDQAKHFAERVEKSGGESLGEKIDLAFRIALGRKPALKEQAWSTALFERQAERHRADQIPAEQAADNALVSLCHTLFNTNEFLYLE